MCFTTINEEEDAKIHVMNNKNGSILVGSASAFFQGISMHIRTPFNVLFFITVLVNLNIFKVAFNVKDNHDGHIYLFIYIYKNYVFYLSTSTKKINK